MGSEFAVTSAMIWGIQALPVRVEVSISGGLPGITIVGRPDTAVSESKSRVRCAIRAAGFSVPRESITVNLSPSELKKSGTAFDLPIALGILVASGQISPSGLDGSLVVGELSLEGRVVPVRGMLAYHELANSLGLDLVCPTSRLLASPEGEDRGRFVSRLAEFRNGVAYAGEPLVCEQVRAADGVQADFAEVSGQEMAKRAMVVAAAGRLGMLMVGPPGIGKTMLARCMPGILPPITGEELRETMLIHSVAGAQTFEGGSWGRPFRAPHHSASVVGLIGGGKPVGPGEVSLAHKGVLFLDELAEFPRSTLQALRQPLEERRVRITRAEGTYEFPSDFQLLAASNPCPCGHYGDRAGSCSCTPTAIANYRAKLVGPLIDRIDVVCQLQRPTPQEMLQPTAGLTTSQLRQAVCAGRDYASWREERLGLDARPEGSHAATTKFASLIARYAFEDPAVHLLEEAMKRKNISLRGIASSMKVARTIADLEQAPRVSPDHVLEALGLRDDSVAR